MELTAPVMFKTLLTKAPTSVFSSDDARWSGHTVNISPGHICEYVVINKFCLLTSVSDTDRGGTTFSTVAPVKEIPVC